MASRAFWDDLERDLQDPAFLREYVLESMRISTIDAVINELDEVRQASELSKADLARAIQADPATIRRLFSAEHVNPTLGTLAEVSAALGFRVTLEPISEAEQRYVTEPLLEGRVANTGRLARHVERIRSAKRG